MEENILQIGQHSTFWGGVGTFLAAVGLTIYNIFKQHKSRINGHPTGTCDKKCSDHMAILQQHVDKYEDVDRRLKEGSDRFREIDKKLDTLQSHIVGVRSDVSYIKGKMERL